MIEPKNLSENLKIIPAFFALGIYCTDHYRERAVSKINREVEIRMEELKLNIVEQELNDEEIEASDFVRILTGVLK